MIKNLDKDGDKKITAEEVNALTRAELGSLSVAFPTLTKEGGYGEDEGNVEEEDVQQEERPIGEEEDESLPEERPIGGGEEDESLPPSKEEL